MQAPLPGRNLLAHDAFVSRPVFSAEFSNTRQSHSIQSRLYAAGITGDVILQVEIDETGRVVRSLAVEGDPLLVAASVEALRDFRFRPYLLNRIPLSVESQMGFRFVLKGKGDKAKSDAAYTSDVPYRPEFRTAAVTDKGILVLLSEQNLRSRSAPANLSWPESRVQSTSQ